MARQSFFAEMRSGKNDPNFFKNMKMSELRKNVRRIIIDIKYDNISMIDYSYFQNETIIDACMQECMHQSDEVRATLNALNSYYNDLKNRRYVPYYNFDLFKEMTDVSEKIREFTDKYYLWYNLYTAFYCIRYCNAEIHSVMGAIRLMNFDPSDL